MSRSAAAPTAEEFRAALARVLAAAQRAGRAEIVVTSGDLHRGLGGYPGPCHSMPTCCDVMRGAIRAGDTVVHSPPKGRGATLRVRYRLPRPT